VPRRKKTYEATYPEGWVISEEYSANGRNIVKDTELSINNEKGRFRFIKHVINGDKEWIDVLGSNNQFRSFRPSQIKRVNWKNKTRENAKKVN
jgi:hypothetical protein